MIPTYRALLLALGLATAPALVPGVAHADQYVVDHCRNWATNAPGVAFPSVTGVTTETCGTGGASVAVLQRRQQSGADPVRVATAQTAADGTFSYKLPRGPSRTVTFAYSAFSGDAEPTTTSSLRTVVRALVSASIRPRSVRAGRKITLTGRLGLLGHEGIEVEIQARNGRVWRTVGTVKTTRSGRFRWPYRFSRAGAGSTFAFRVRVDSPIYPFAAGNSRPILVRVR